MSFSARVAGFCMVAGVALLPASASGAAAFLPPTDLGPAVADTHSLQVIADPNGSATLTFTRGGVINVATKQPGALFSEPQVLATGGGAELWSAPGQRTLATWVKDGHPWFAVREAGATSFGAPVETAITGAIDAAGAVGPSGRLYLATAGSSGQGAQLLSAAPGTTAFEPATTIALAGDVRGVAVSTEPAVDGAWLVTAGADLVTEQQGSSVKARRWLATGGEEATQPIWQRAHALLDGGFPVFQMFADYNPAAIPGGPPGFMWEAGGALLSQFLTATMSGVARAGLSMQPEPLPPGFDNTVVPSTRLINRTPFRFATEPSGAATVAWSRRDQKDDQPSRIGLLRRNAAGTWLEPRQLDELTAALPPDSVADVAVASAGPGFTHVLYTVGGNVLTSKVSVDDTTPAPTATQLTDPVTPVAAGHPAGAGTGSGDAVAGWIEQAGGVGQVVTAFADVTAPSLEVAPVAAPSPPVPLNQTDADVINTQLRQQTFDATAADIWTPATVTWDFGDGQTATGASVTYSFATPGSKTITATATDLAGNTKTVTVQRDIPLVTYEEPVPETTPTPTPKPSATPAPGGGSGVGDGSGSGGAPGSGGGTSGAPPAPAISGAGLTKVSFAAGESSAFVLTASESGVVRVLITKATPGRKVAGVCKPQTAKNKKRKKCSYDKLVTTLSGPQAAGKISIPFNGKIGKKKLAPGTYKATITVTGASGLASKPAVLTFKIKKKKK